MRCWNSIRSAFAIHQGARGANGEKNDEFIHIFLLLDIDFGIGAADLRSPLQCVAACACVFEWCVQWKGTTSNSTQKNLWFNGIIIISSFIWMFTKSIFVRFYHFCRIYRSWSPDRLQCSSELGASTYWLQFAHMFAICEGHYFLFYWNK